MSAGLDPTADEHFTCDSGRRDHGICVQHGSLFSQHAAIPLAAAAQDTVTVCTDSGNGMESVCSVQGQQHVSNFLLCWSGSTKSTSNTPFAQFAHIDSLYFELRPIPITETVCKTLSSSRLCRC